MRLGSFTITHQRRARRTRRAAPRMLVIVVLASLVSLTLHEVFYHRFTPASVQDYPFYGVLSHPATDMVLQAFLVILAVVVELHRQSNLKGGDE